MILERVSVGSMDVNCYVLARAEGAKAVIIDPGDDEQKIRAVLKRHKLSPGLVINTHGHFDHIGSNDAFAVPVYIHEMDAPMLKDPKLNLSVLVAGSVKSHAEVKSVKDKDLIILDGVELEVLHTPGHTAGGISLLLKKPQARAVFTGDTLFYQGVGRTDLGGDAALLFQGIKDNLFVLPDDTAVYPGHGPFSTIGREKINY
jgi:glyoxylase-like metal-dependent hydrolase (beta-lactamase superfamily II)